MNSKIYLCWIFMTLINFSSVYSQSPGGVTPSAWYRTDASNTVFSDAGITPASNNATIYQWNSVIGNFPLLQASSGSRPVFSNTSVQANFNPTVTFDGSNDWMQFTAGTGISMIDRTNGTLYAAGYMNQLKRSGFLGFHASMDYPGLHFFSDNKMLFFTGGPGYQGVTADVMAAQTYFNTGSGWQNGGGSSASYAGATVSLNGTRTDYTGTQLNNANLSTGARDLRIGADNNYGSFSGQLNEILVFENKLSTAQMDQVETYLALKYGTTYAAGTRDYKNAAGATVWTVDAGYSSNIAGIGRDEALYQKQSWSTNIGQQVLVGVGALSNTNAANSGSLTEGQYLIWGDNGLAKTPNVAITGITGVSHRFASVWKVQNTGSVGTVRIAWVKNFSNLRLIQSTDNVISSSDVVTDMSVNETTVNGVVYNYADVTLANGEYFTFAAKAAAPGGVFADLRVWLKSDNGFTPGEWQDRSGNTNNYTQTNASRQPFTATSSFNFNPVVDFGTTGSNARFMAIPAGKPYSANGTSSSVFTVNLDRSVGGYADILGFGATTTTASLINANLPVFTRLGANVVNYPYADASPALPPVAVNRLYLNDVSYTVGVSGIKYGQNGTTGANTQTVSTVYSKHADGSILGSQPEERNGLIGEVIAYERDLTEAEKQRVRTYTAIKYGITLPHNYIASDGATVIWNQAINAGFNANIAGIASDEGSALVQKQSQSINPGIQVLIATTGLAGSNTLNGTALANGQSLVWGDNGLSKTLSASFNFPSVPTLNLRFGAIWKAQNMGTVGTVRVAWPSGIPSLTLIQSTNATIDNTDTRTDMTANSISVNGVSYNYADVVLSDGEYFTFAGFVSGPGNVASAAWYRADAAGQQFSDAGTTVAADGATLQQWNEYKGTGYNLTQTTASGRPVFSNTSTLANFNPTVTFNGGQWMRYDVTGTTNVIDRENGAIYASGYLNRLTNVDIAGFGETTLDYPGLHTHTTGGNLRTLFYTASNGGSYTGISDSNLLNKHYFTMGGAWQNGAGSPNTFLGATVSQNGIRKIYSGNEISNITNFANNASNIYRSFRIGDGNYGPLYGQLNEVVVFEQRLVEDEMNRVETYMAIKYGTTYAAGTKDYVNSSSATVWANTANNGYHFNIAGIARDDMGSLYQKQSWSTNPGNQVLISTTGLDNTNTANSGVLANGQFLIWGDNNLAKAPTVSIAGISGVNYRFAAIWKEQNTNGVGVVRVAWPQGLTNLKLIQSSDDNITSADVITDMEGVQTVNGVAYAYADVTLSDGQYFTFAAFIQAPGGVTNNLNYWYRADKLVRSAGVGTEVTSWTDFTSGTVSTLLGDNAGPVLTQGSSTYLNFNPGLNFTATSQSLGNLSVQTFTNNSYDVFALTKDGINPGGNGRIFSSLIDNSLLAGSINYWDAFGDMADNRSERVNTAQNYRFLATVGGSRPTTHPSIVYHNLMNTTTGKAINGAAIATSGVHPAIGSPNGGHAFGSTQFSGNGSDNAGFTGNLGEVVIYGNGNVTAQERNKVESYLAIKYGVTLNNANNYTTSQDVVVWDATANTGFYNNVAGIGNDLISALHQKQSRSQHANTNSQVIIGLGDIAETNIANNNSLNDGQFLMWGDNNNTQSLTAAFTTFTYAGTSVSRRMNRIWKVQNTGLANELKIKFPVASVGTTTLTANDACASYAIIYSSDAAFTTNVVAVPLTVNGTDYEAMHSFPAGMSYFTFGKATPLSAGTVYLPDVVEATNEYGTCGIGEWTYYHKASESTQNLFALSGFTSVEMNNFEIVIVPDGTEYDDGTVRTRLMPRITTVTDNGSSSSTGKVRVYYSVDELNNTGVSGSLTNGWFKYEGDANAVIEDVYNDGLLDGTKAIALTPNATGVEAGVNYVEFHNISSFSSFIYVSSTKLEVLPVTLLNFEVELERNVPTLRWATATEQINKGFEIERSADGRSWSKLAFVSSKALNGNSSVRLDYAYIDNTPLNGVNFYRLKQVDLDNQYTYSQVRQVSYHKPGSITLAPNPVHQETNIMGLKGNNLITVTNTAGQVMAKILIKNVSEHAIDMSRYKPGIYFVRIENADGEIENHKVMKY